MSETEFVSDPITIIERQWKTIYDLEAQLAASEAARYILLERLKAAAAFVEVAKHFQQVSACGYSHVAKEFKKALAAYESLKGGEE